MASLRRRLVLGTTIGTAAVLSAAGILLHVFVRAGLLDQFDRSLIDKARLLASTVEAEFGRVDLEFEELDMREFHDPGGPGYLEVWLADGSVAFRSRSLGEGDLEPVAGPMESPACRWVRLPRGRSGRAVGIAFQPASEYEYEGLEYGSNRTGETPGATVTLVMARDTASMDLTLNRLKALLLSVGLATILVSVGVLWWAIRLGVRPLGQVATQIGRLGEQDLSARVRMADAPREIQPVIEKLNDLLGRLETAFRRERSFSSNVAHELRTPLAGLRSTMEVTLSRPRGSEQYREALGDSLVIATQMQNMVEKLLSLARLDAGQVEVRPSQVFPNDLIHSCWAPLADSAEGRGLQAEWLLGPQSPVRTDPLLLELAIRNILDNAVAYADNGGTLKIETVVSPDRTDIRVGNSGSKLAQDEAERALERFWRGDTARSAVGIRCGLGLSLVKRVAEVLGGSVGVRSRAGGRFEVTLSIPSGPAQ